MSEKSIAQNSNSARKTLRQLAEDRIKSLESKGDEKPITKYKPSDGTIRELFSSYRVLTSINKKTRLYEKAIQAAKEAGNEKTVKRLYDKVISLYETEADKQLSESRSTNPVTTYTKDLFDKALKYAVDAKNDEAKHRICNKVIDLCTVRGDRLFGYGDGSSYYETAYDYAAKYLDDPKRTKQIYAKYKKAFDAWRKSPNKAI